MRYPIKLLNLIIVTFLIILLPACHVGRFFYWNFAGINDYKKLHAVPVNRGGETFYFDEFKNYTLINNNFRYKTFPYVQDIEFVYIMDGEGNFWYDPTSFEGNWWSDWDEISAYPIDGSASSLDLYPLGVPGIPELEDISNQIMLIFLFGLIFVSFSIILKKKSK